MYRLVMVLGIAVTLSVSGALGLVRSEDPTSVTPAVPPAAVESAPPDDLAGLIGSLQERLRRLPTDDAAWSTLALAYVEQARVTGNPTYYRQADRAVHRSLTLEPRDNADAEAAEAALEAARHHFAAALAASNRALRTNPYQAGALAVRVDALTELGRYRAQLAALTTADRRQPGIPVAARYAYARELRGDLGVASRVLEQAADGARPSDQAFLLTLLGDIDRRRGLLDASHRHLSQALHWAPGYVPALAGRARLAVARGDEQLAVTRWTTVVQALPLAEYVTELGELQQHLGHPQAARQQYAVVNATTRLLDRSGVDTDLESALFEADHGDPAAAVADARAEWSRRHSIHVADVLGWSLHRTGHDAEALRFSRHATSLGTAEARLWLHRGTIEAALGQRRAARAHLARGLRTDPGYAPLQASAARDLLARLRVGP